MAAIPLHKTGKLVEPFDWPIEPQDDPPRALRTLSRIIEDDLCHRCGSCIGICPTDVFGLDDRDYPIVENLSACTDCDLCVKVCSGDEFDAKTVSQEMFGVEPDIKNLHGFFLKAYLAFATDPEVRQQSTSGGLVTALLIALLERKIIDGAIVIASDEDVLWKGKPVVARTKEAILAAAKSKYAISPTNAAFKEIREFEGKYALVGLPCQIHGFHKAALLDRRIKERVVLTIGLFCHAAVDHPPFEQIWNSLGTSKDKATKFISRVGKHPGTPQIVLEDGSTQHVYFPKAKGFRPHSTEMLNILYRLYTPPRCLTCYDAMAEFADLAVGDPWMAPPNENINFSDGYSFALVRTASARKLLNEIKEAGDIDLVPLTREEALGCNIMMSKEKKHRAFRVIETRRRQGHAIPEYRLETPRLTGRQKIMTEINMLSHIFCYLPWGQKTILRIMLSPVGYALMWLNHQKRRFREKRRDMQAK